MAFGKNWNIWIIDKERDFYYVVDGSVKFILLKTVQWRYTNYAMIVVYKKYKIPQVTDSPCAL